MGQVSYSQTIKATPEQLWAIISDVTRLPDWAYRDGQFPYPVEGKYGSDQQEGVGTIWIGVSADQQEATQKITAWDPPKKLVYELQEAKNAPLLMTQINRYELEPTSDGTQISWTVDWELTGDFSFAKLLARFTVGGSFEEMIVGSLENLQTLVEGNQPDG